MTPILRLQESLSDRESILIFSDITRRYLTSFASSDGVLLVLKEKAFLFLDSRYLEMAEISQSKGKIPSEIQICPTPYGPCLEELLSEKKGMDVYFEDRSVTCFQLEELKKKFPSAVFSPLEDKVEKMRIVKREEEIEKIRASQHLAEEAFSYILTRISSGRFEREIAAELEFFMKKNGASAPSFETICVSGERSSLPHGKPEGKIENNTFLTLDFGCVLSGYASDMTRTVCVGKASDEMKFVYETVLKAQETAISKVKAGVLGREVDKAARDVIASAGFGEYFGHSTGHGIGLLVHEAPSFSPKSEEIIPAGAVLSVEPGIYLPGKFGVRIEDLLVVRENGFENLNQSPKDLIEL